jgi:hypothetical protein
MQLHLMVAMNLKHLGKLQMTCNYIEHMNLKLNYKCNQ